MRPPHVRAPAPTEFEAVLRQHEPLCRRIAADYFLPGAEREDLVQEARLGLWKAWRGFDPARGVPFGVFAALVVRRQVVTAVKGATRIKHSALTMRAVLSPALVDMGVGGTMPDPADVVVEREAADEAAACVLAACVRADLSPLEAECVAWRVTGAPLRDVAVGMGVSRRRVDNAQQRARKKLAPTIADRRAS